MLNLCVKKKFLLVIQQLLDMVNLLHGCGGILVHFFSTLLQLLRFFGIFRHSSLSSMFSQAEVWTSRVATPHTLHNTPTYIGMFTLMMISQSIHLIIIIWLVMNL